MVDEMRQYYTTIFSLAYSPCGYYLAACDNYGSITIFNLTPYLDKEESILLRNTEKGPFYKFSAHSSPVFSLVSSKKLLISGSIGEIKAWKWSDLKRKEAKPVWTYYIPQGENLTKPEVNSMVLGSKDDESLLYFGCGDFNVYCLDIETQALKLTFEGHIDYVHSVDVGSSGQECVSGSEDGSVRIWDARSGGRSVHILEPFRHKMADRPEVGRWIGCVAYDSSDDWLACGGAPSLCIWHVRSLSPATRMAKPRVATNVVLFSEDGLISAGSESCINHWSLDGNLNIEVPSSAVSMFSVAVNTSPSQQILAASGTSWKIDVCTDFRYRDFSLSVFD